MSRFFQLYRRRRFSPYEIYFNDLLNPIISDEALKNYMSKEEAIAFDRQHVLDTYLCVTSDKAVFYSLCLAAGIPIPKLLAVFDLPAGWIPDGRLLASRSDWCAFMQSLPNDFVIKPALGLLGKGVAAVHRDGGSFLSHDGHRRTAEELYEFLCDKKDHNLFATGYSHHSLRLPGESYKSIIQERIYAHPEIAQLTDSVALSTCRLTTYIDRNRDVQLVASMIKVINGNNIADNFDKGTMGNLWCKVDPTTGAIVEAWIKATEGDSLKRIDRHPTTRREVVGFRIPQWAGVVELAHHLANVFRPQSAIHWDIGVTGAGPVVIEGNVGGSVLPSSLNLPTGALLAET